MLSTQCTIESNGEAEDIFLHLFRSFDLVGIIFIEKNLGMEVSIARMAKRGNDNIVFF